MYYNFESSVAVRSFLTTIVHHAKNLPSISILRYLMKKFELGEGAKEETVKRVARLYVARRLSLR